MSKQIFRKDDRVFDIDYGWGVVVAVNDLDSLPIYVRFENNYVKYTTDGKKSSNSIAPTLSFTKYELGDKFSQEKTINYANYVGKWGKFWNSNSENIVIDKLDFYHKSHDKPFSIARCESFEFFQPLTDKQIKILK